MKTGKLEQLTFDNSQHNEMLDNNNEVHIDNNNEVHIDDNISSDSEEYDSDDEQIRPPNMDIYVPMVLCILMSLWGIIQTMQLVN